jgi:hypothetical protein
MHNPALPASTKAFKIFASAEVKFTVAPSPHRKFPAVSTTRLSDIESAEPVRAFMILPFHRIYGMVSERLVDKLGVFVKLHIISVLHTNGEQYLIIYHKLN